MANDVLNTAGNNTGTSVIGQVTVNTGGRKANVRKTYNPAQPRVGTTTVADVSSKFDARFDDPRYYTGDATT